MIRPPDEDHFVIFCRFSSRVRCLRRNGSPAGVLCRGIYGRRRRHFIRDGVAALRNGAGALRKRVRTHREVVAAIGADGRTLKDGINICRDDDSLRDSLNIRSDGVITRGKGAKLLWRCLAVRKDLIVWRLTERRGKHGIGGDPVFAGRWRLPFSRRSLLFFRRLGRFALCHGFVVRLGSKELRLFHLNGAETHRSQNRSELLA
jgi:hypothetical protein